jgi:general secretion pathway protein I
VTRGRPEAGFTLLEVLVALVILSVTLVAALQLVGGSLRLARASADHVAATLLADGLLAETGPGPLPEGRRQGSDGPYRWVREVTAAEALRPFAPDEPGADAVRLARVRVTVSWGRDRRVELTTLRAWREGS